MNPDPEENDQHGPVGVEGAFLAAVCFIGACVLVALEELRLWLWRILHDETD